MAVIGSKQFFKDLALVTAKKFWATVVWKFLPETQWHATGSSCIICIAEDL